MVSTMDDLDRAKDLEMGHREASIQAQLQNGKITDPPLIIDGVRHCIDCEEPIPARRLEVQPESVRCVPCKSIFERERG